MDDLPLAMTHSKSSALTGLGVRFPSSALTRPPGAGAWSRVAAGFALQLVLTLTLPSAVWAATFAVNSLLDLVDASPGDGLCASLAGACTLRAAIQEANAEPGGDLVTLPPGIYTLELPPVLEDDEGSGDLDIRDELDIRGAGAFVTLIEGNGADGVIDALGAPAIALRGVTIRGAAGAGVFADFALLEDTIVTENLQGGLFVGQLELVDTIVSDNVAAGVWAFSADVRNSLIERNEAKDGAGLYCDNFCFLGRTIIAANVATGLGGGLFVPNEVQVELVDVEIAGNEAPGGGGIAVVGDGSVLVRSSAIHDNVAVDGGGLALVSDCSAALIVNSTLSGNRATGHGGAILGNGPECGALRLRNVTVVGNVADSDGDGIGTGGGLSLDLRGAFLSNSILASNLAGGTGSDCRGTLTSEGHNLIQTLAGCALAGTTTGNLLGVDPGLAPLADNGGPTPTHALQPGSPALDAGDPAPPGDTETACEPADQRGIARPQRRRCDMGAYEMPCEDGGDQDADGVCDALDNCPANVNRDQNDLDGDGRGDVCDPEDAVLAVIRVSMRPDGRATRDTGEVVVVGSLLTSPPRYPLPPASFQMEVRDGRGLHEAYSWNERQCTVSARRMTCRSDDRSFVVTFRRAHGARARYFFRTRFGGLAAAPPLEAPVMVAIHDAASVDRIGGIPFCRPVRGGALKCP